MAAKPRNPLELPKGLNRRVDLPPEAYWHEDRKDYTPFAVRPGYATKGTDIKVLVNQYRVKSVGNRDVFQYDVSLIPEPKGAIVYKKVWALPEVKAKLNATKAPWLHDGRKLAWTTVNVPSLKIDIDLGAAEGRPGRQNDKFVLELKQTCKIRMEVLKAYLEKRAHYDPMINQCMSFLDHLMRQGPSERFHLLKRTFVNEYSKTLVLNSYSEAVKGIYSTIRINDSLKSGGVGLGINVDISNQTFWVAQSMENLARNFVALTVPRMGNVDFQQLAEACRPVRKVDEKGNASWVPSETFQQLKKLKGVRFTVTHRGNKDNANKKEYKVKSIYFDPSFEGQGVNARNYYFDKKNDDGTTQRINLYDYYLQVHRVRIQYPLLPLVETGNAGLFPLEFCKVDRFNPYPYKLDADQTSAMITFSQARPQALKHELAEAVQNLDWQKDRYLAHFGVKIDTQMPTVQAKLLPNPVVQYGNITKDPKTAGRWDLRGVKFLSPNKEEITRWAIVIFDQFVDKAAAQNFGNQFKSVYINHGGKISGNPLIFTGDPKNPDGPVEKSYFSMLNTWKGFPQLVFYILPQKKSQPYDAIKKQVECRFGFMSQMVLGKHVKKCSPQYLSNVCLKVNAKLGGQNARIALKQPFFSVPTMMIGVDISHGATALNQVSTAAMCVSMDKDATIYTTSIQTNGWGVEIVQPFNMHDMLGPRILEWQKLNRCLPQHVFYMRDGVSEGQYAQVLDYEVKEIKRIFKEFFKHTPKITVVVATKRHHIRIFPERGDKNGNCLPGTLVEREVVHPFHYEFYLCSHVALQGTARPVRYNVIYDECGLPPDTLQRIIYEQSYQFCRSTTPVSLHPAVYYAHLAGARARQHEPRDPNATQKAPDGWVYLTRPKTGFLAKSEATRTSRPKDAIPAKLLKFATYQQVPEYKALAKVNEERMWWV